MTTLIRYSILILVTAVTVFQHNLFAQTTKTPVIINGVRFELLGSWEHINSNEESGQYGFLERESNINIAISVRKPEKMEFYKSELKGFDLIQAFYKWDSEYWAKDTNYKVSKMSEDRLNYFIVWSIKIPQGENIFLFGLKSDKIINISLNRSSGKKKMNDAEAINFLKNIYLN
jgi:hypothetical protein